ASRLNFWPIATSGTSQCHWLFFQWSRCTNLTKETQGRLTNIPQEVYRDVEHRYDFLPTCEPFLTPKLETSPNYMDWFRHNSKSYLLLDSERSRQRPRRRPR
ncbi:hypothetical protein Gotri_000859, partial [Gossypium trilobum]|nr:hypothetical protein [Gossypium trilobum]